MGGRFEEAVMRGDEALAAARESGDPAALVDALHVWLYRADSRFPAGLVEDWRPAAEEARALATGLGDWGRLGRLESEVAMIEARRDPTLTEEALQRAVAAAERSGSPQELAYLNQVRGRLASMAGRPAEAQAFFRASYAQFESVGDHRFALSAQSELGHALRREGRAEEAEAEALTLATGVPLAIAEPEAAGVPDADGLAEALGVSTTGGA